MPRKVVAGSLTSGCGSTWGAFRSGRWHPSTDLLTCTDCGLVPQENWCWSMLLCEKPMSTREIAVRTTDSYSLRCPIVSHSCQRCHQLPSHNQRWVEAPLPMLIVAVSPKQMATSLNDYPNHLEEVVAQPPWESTSYPTSTTMACPTTHAAHNRPFSLYAKTPKSFGPCHCRMWTWHGRLTNPEHVEMYKSQYYNICTNICIIHIDILAQVSTI